MNVPVTQQYGQSLSIDSSRRCWCRSFMLLKEVSPVFSAMTSAWVKEASRNLSYSLLVFDEASVITALCNSPLVVLLISLGLFCLSSLSGGRLVFYWQCAPLVLVRLGRLGLYDSFEAVFLPQKNDGSGAFGTIILYAARAIVRALPTAEWGSLANAVAYMHLPAQVDPRTIDAPLVFSNFYDVLDVELETEGE